MAKRIVAVEIGAKAAEYIDAFGRMKTATRELGSEADKLAEKREAFNQIGTAGVAMGALIAAGVGVAVAKFAEFDEAMSAVQASTHESAENMELLRDAAIEAGSRTVFSATEAANAIEELAKAGVSTSDILSGGLDASLDLAAAGGLGVAEAAGIAATALKTFNLQGEDMSHVADLLAAGAGKAMGDVSDLSQALAQGGQVARSTGLSIEETTAALSAFAAQGLLGSDAGTSFKSMLQRLTPQSAEAQQEMDRLGISAYDASGNFVGLAEFAGSLQSALEDLTPQQRNAALATIFGSDAVRAANVIYAEGADGIRDWVAAVDDQGYAAETAAARLDNLKGDLEALQGAMDSALITTGAAANDTLRAMVQTLTGLVDMYNDLPEPIQGAVLAIGGATAAIALTGGTAFLAIPKIAAFKSAMKDSELTMRGLSLTAGAAGLALGGLFAIVSTLATRQAEAQATAEQLADTLDQVTGAATASSRAFVADLLTKKGNGLFGIPIDSVQDWGDKLGISLDTATNAALGTGDAMDQLSIYYRAAKDDAVALKIITDETGLSTDKARDYAQQFTRGLDDLRGKTSAAADELERQNDVTETAGEVTAEAADAYLEAADGAGELESKLRQLIDTINEANGIGQDAVTANARYQSALEGVRAEVDKQRDAYQEAHGTLDGFNATLDQNTASGAANAAMLADVAQAAQDAALAQYEQDLTTMSADEATRKYSDTLAAQRQAFIDSAIEAGFNADAVQGLADIVFALPTEREMKIVAETSAAKLGIEDLQRQLAELPTSRRINIIVGYPNGARLSDQQIARQLGIGSYGSANGNLFDHDRQKVQAFADGGRIDTGIYPGRPGGLLKFAEEETKWEAFISGKPGQEERNRQITLDAAQRLGMSVGNTTNVTNNNWTMPVVAEPGVPITVQAVKLVRRLESRRVGR